MTRENNIRRDIERDERWLEEVADDAGGDGKNGLCYPPPTEAIKQRVRIALGERWLASLPAGDSNNHLCPPPELARRVKQRVWAECGRLRDARRATVSQGSGSAAPRWRFGLGMRVAVSVAAAVAAFAFVTRLMWPVAQPPGADVVVGDVPPVEVRTLAVEVLLASLKAPASEDDVDLSLLEHDIRMMELSVSEPVEYGVGDEEMVDELYYEESERLLAELEADLG